MSSKSVIPISSLSETSGFALESLKPRTKTGVTTESFPSIYGFTIVSGSFSIALSTVKSASGLISLSATSITSSGVTLPATASAILPRL